MRTQEAIDRTLSHEPEHLDPVESTVRAHVESILSSPHFDATARSRDFFRYIVEETLAGRTENLNQSAIAVAVFGRRQNFDAILDPIVRVQAGRLRRSLERYYLLAGDADAVHIKIPKGSYTPVFVNAPVKHVANSEPPSDITVKNILLTEVTHDWPTMVVHAFDRFPTQEADDAALHLQEQLTMEFYRYGGVHIARSQDVDRLAYGRSASARFELRGAMRKIADGYLIGARLVDKTTGEQVWGDEYLTGEKASSWCRNIDDVARVIAARLGAEHGVVVRLLARECSTRAETNDAFSTILRCDHFFLSRQVADLPPAIRAMEQLTSSEPEDASAWTNLARLYVTNYTLELCDTSTPIAKAIGYAYRGMSLDPASVRSRCVLAKALLVKGELEAAQNELDQTLRLNPDSLAYREVIGWLLAFAGDWDRGTALMREAVERNPFCLPHVKFGLWADNLRRGNFERAYVSALEYWDATFFWRELMIASSLGHLGRQSEADAIVLELLQAKPNFPERGRTLIGYYIKSADLRDQIVEGLRKAGLILS